MPPLALLACFFICCGAITELLLPAYEALRDHMLAAVARIFRSLAPA